MMSEPSVNPLNQLTDREHRWLMALLILGTVAVGFVVLYFVTGLLAYFNDVIMVFFLAWLLAFILSPVANGLLRLFPRLPRAIAVMIVYGLLILVVVIAILLVAQQLYSSINSLLNSISSGSFDRRLHDLLDPLQSRLDSLGGNQINLYAQVKQLLDNLNHGADQLLKPLGDVAIASLGIFGNVLFVFFLSLYMAVDRDRIVRFLFRLVPPAYDDEARLLEHSVSKSFGGFLRGQALLGVLYGIISLAASVLLGLPYTPVTATSSGVLQAIPFFGPFISWAPPVLVALFFKPEAALPVLIIMIAGWFVLMNIIQPRLMADAVGLHPVVVLGSVLIGSKIAGIPGAVFGVPVAAVVAAFFFYYLGRNRDTASVALRAARRVEEREGRPIRVPRLPQPGEDQEVEPAVATEPQPGLALRRRAPRTAPSKDADPAG
jgi:predicted PurR-regulated permease PerM